MPLWNFLGGRTFVFVGFSLGCGFCLAVTGKLTHEWIALVTILCTLFTARAICDDWLNNPTPKAPPAKTQTTVEVQTETSSHN